MNERECRLCPPWVVRCAHWEGRVIVLGDGSNEHNHLPPAADKWLDITFSVRTIRSYAPCPNEGCPSIVVDGDEIVEPAYFWSEAALPSAEAEFYRREAELLGREVYA